MKFGINWSSGIGGKIVDAGQHRMIPIEVS